MIEWIKSELDWLDYPEENKRIVSSKYKCPYCSTEVKMEEFYIVSKGVIYDSEYCAQRAEERKGSYVTSE